ncbi:MAG: hypothetical protein V1494_01595 [Candidatus Diapherotrites archaeon]
MASNAGVSRFFQGSKPRSFTGVLKKERQKYRSIKGMLYPRRAEPKRAFTGISKKERQKYRSIKGMLYPRRAEPKLEINPDKINLLNVREYPALQSKLVPLPRETFIPFRG